MSAITISGSFSWGSSNGRSGDGRKPPGSSCGTAAAVGERAGPVLQGIELAVPAGALVALTGPVGSCKSSLLAAMLGEMLPAGDQQPDREQQQRGALEQAAGDRETLLKRQDSEAAGGSRGASRSCIAAGYTGAFVPQDAYIMHGSIRCIGAGRRDERVAWRG